jgi:hypothetical protein
MLQRSEHRHWTPMSWLFSGIRRVFAFREAREPRRSARPAAARRLMIHHGASSVRTEQCTKVAVLVLSPKAGRRSTSGSRKHSRDGATSNMRQMDTLVADTQLRRAVRCVMAAPNVHVNTSLCAVRNSKVATSSRLHFCDIQAEPAASTVALSTSVHYTAQLYMIHPYLSPYRLLIIHD